MNHSVGSGFRVGLRWLRAFFAEEKPIWLSTGNGVVLCICEVWEGRCDTLSIKWASLGHTKHWSPDAHVHPKPETQRNHKFFQPSW